MASGERAMTVGAALDKLGALAAVGVDTTILGMANDTEEEPYELLAELVERADTL